MEQVNELFALPIGLKLAVKIDNIQLYTSDTIKERYRDSIAKSRITSKVSQEINMLIDKGKIVPCFASSGMITFIRNKMISTTKQVLGKLPTNFFVKQFSSLALGFYMPEEKKLVVIVDNSVSFSGLAGSDNDIIARITAHELIHMVASENGGKFLSIFKDEFNSFYKKLFEYALKLKDVPDKDIESVYKFFFNVCERKGTFSLYSIYKKFMGLKQYSSLNEEEYKLSCVNYIRAVKTWSMDPNLFKRKIETEFLDIVRGIHNGYKLAFGGVSYDVLYGQELVFPSEVIAVSTEIKMLQKTSKLIRSIL